MKWKSIGNRMRAGPLIPAILGLALLGAAWLKGYQLATSTVPGVSIWSSRWFLIGLTEFEVVFGLFLCSGVFVRLARLLGLGCFACYFLFSLFYALKGEATCPCLPNLKISPMWVGGFDLGAIGSLLLWQTGPANWLIPGTHPWRLGALGTGIALLGIPGFFAMNHYQPAEQLLVLQRDPALRTTLDLKLTNPGRAEILERLERATGISMRVDDKLADRPLEAWSLALQGVYAWKVMELVAQVQGKDVYWQQLDGGYRLRQLPIWMRGNPWMAAGLTVGICFAGWATACLWGRRRIEAWAS